MGLRFDTCNHQHCRNLVKQSLEGKRKYRQSQKINSLKITVKSLKREVMRSKKNPQISTVRMENIIFDKYYNKILLVIII